MLIRYKLVEGFTMSDVIADINGLMGGTITTVNGLSSSCNKTVTTITGSYPANTFVRVSNSTNTYSKTHHLYNTDIHYFRFDYDSTRLTNCTFAQSYTSGTDTLVNTQVVAINLTFVAYDETTQAGIDIVINDKNFFIGTIGSLEAFGVFDCTDNGVKASFADNMRMALIDVGGTTSAGAGSTAYVPYVYKFNGSLSGYGSHSVAFTPIYTPTIRSGATGQILVFENPVFFQVGDQGSSTYGVYNLLYIPPGVMELGRVYNTSGVRRIHYYNTAIITE